MSCLVLNYDELVKLRSEIATDLGYEHLLNLKHDRVGTVPNTLGPAKSPSERLTRGLDISACRGEFFAPSWI